MINADVSSLARFTIGAVRVRNTIFFFGKIHLRLVQEAFDVRLDIVICFLVFEVPQMVDCRHASQFRADLDLIIRGVSVCYVGAAVVLGLHVARIFFI